MKIKKKHIAWTVASCLLAVAVVAQACYWAVSLSTKGQVYSSVKDVPYNEVGMVLGTGPTTKWGRANRFFLYRIDAVVELYKAKKIRFVLISGDNSHEDYSEPDVMRDSLIAKGVPSDVIYLDYAGFRTWDSVIRAKEVFGQSKMTVVSQKFHNERSIFIGRRFDMELVGFNAKDTPSRRNMLRAYLRENLARVKIFVDLLTGKRPHFLGDPIEIGEGKPQKDVNPKKGRGMSDIMKTESDGRLIFYYPRYRKVDLVCGTMPSPNDTSVLFCCEAAFTGECLNEFRHGNIAGDHVSGGVRYKGYRAASNTGCFAYYPASGTWEFAYRDYAHCLRKAEAGGGMAFGQNMIIYKGKDVHKEGWHPGERSKNMYRALCEKNGKLCVADSKQVVPYKDFVSDLLKAGVVHALYLDMGKGWNYSFYRDDNGKVRFIHNQRIKYTTNWLTFYK